MQILFVDLVKNKELLDYAEEIVLPAFTDDTLVRTYGKSTQFFLYETKFEMVEDSEVPTLALTGHFVKDTILRRTQIFQDGQGLVQDEDQMESSPSAFFVLILNDHKLLYLPETSDAPNVQTFSSTIRTFLIKKHNEFILELQKGLRETGERASKKSLIKTHPKPSLVVTPLASQSSIEEFLKRYKTLKSLELTLVKTNQEIQGKEVWKKVRGMSEDIKSSKTTVTHRNKDGLETDQAAAQIHDAAASGNQLVKLNGDDLEGNILKGNNDKFSYSVPLAEIPEERENLVKKMYDVFKHAREEGTITTDVSVGNIANVIRWMARLI